MPWRPRPLPTIGLALLFALLVVGVLMVVARRPPGVPVMLEPPPTPVPLRVHVTGAVRAPGVYALPPGSVVQDALVAAGGTTNQADLGTLNLARLLRDGDQVLVPALAPTGAPVAGAAVATGPAASGLININTASAAELEMLPGIGPSLAQRIVDYRTARGPFAAVEDIQQVRGIGPVIFESIRDLIAVN